MRLCGSSGLSTSRRNAWTAARGPVNPRAVLMVRRAGEWRTVEEILRMSSGKKKVVEIGDGIAKADPIPAEGSERVRSDPSGRRHWIRQELFSLAVVLAAVTAARSSL